MTNKKTANKKHTEKTVNLINTNDTGSQLDDVKAEYHFPVPIYFIDKPEFLDITREVASEFIEKRKDEVDLNPIYPLYQSEALNYDPRMLDFSNYVAQTAWNLLNHQGYDMSKYRTFFESMWCQEHHKHSLMEQHVHGYGVQMVGFYFLDCPEPASRVLFYDPKPSKVILNLPESDQNTATIASNMINFDAKPGRLMFTNAWLAHSFTKNASDTPLRFIHFNVAVEYVGNQECPIAVDDNSPAEVI